MIYLSVINHKGRTDEQQEFLRLTATPTCRLKLDANGDISGCQEGLIGTTYILPYDTKAAARRCNEKDQATNISPKKGSASVKGTTVTPAGLCGN